LKGKVLSSKKTSSQLDGMVYGMILGDGHLKKPVEGGNSTFILHHSVKQKEYLLHKLKLLEEISHVKTSTWDKKTFNKKVQKYYFSIFAQTNKLKYFTKLRHKFYNKDGSKILDKKILNKLTPLGLALWWMDDGCLYINRAENKSVERRAYICTHNFSYEQNILIQKYFKEKWDIQTSIRSVPKKGYYFISFPVEEFKKFKSIIEPFIIPSMFYKIDTDRELNRKTGPKPRETRVGT
jgi:hypothetical protein